MQRVKSYSCRR